MSETFLVPYVRAVWENLRHGVGDGNRICILGAGAHTRWLLEVTADLPPPPIACIVDDNPTCSDLHGISVVAPDDPAARNVNLVLVSSDRWEDALAARARTIWGDNVAVVRLYDGLPAGPYDKSDSRSEALHNLSARPANHAPVPRSVVIVSDVPRSREAKIGIALRSAGWYTTLLYRSRPAFDAARYFDRQGQYSDAWTALKLASIEAPAAYHIFAHQDYRVAELFIRHRPGPIVVDPYDVIAGMCTDEFLRIRPSYGDEIPRERWCLENADAVCCRSREAEWLATNHGYAYRRLSHLPDGCWNDARTQPAKHADLSIAYAGGVELAGPGVPLFAAGGLNVAVASRLTGAGIDVHVYPSQAQWAELARQFDSRHEDHSRMRKPFVLHRPVPPDCIVRELSRYALGICVFGECEVPTSAVWRITPAKIATCTTNKLFDYIDAGLPIIHNAPADSLIAGTASRYAVGIDVSDWPIGEWAARLRRIDLAAYQRRLAGAREALDIRHGVATLIDLYESLNDDQERNAAGSRKVDHDDAADRRAGHRPALV